MRSVAIVIPNWNGADFLPDCLQSCLEQTHPCDVIVVDNGSTDESTALVSSQFPSVTLLKQPENLGYAGGVNVGLRHALDHGHEHIAVLNNDARLSRDWVTTVLNRHEMGVGIVTGLLLTADGASVDSSGDMFSTWGIPFARDRGKPAEVGRRRAASDIFAASGGASLLSSEMLRDIGLFHEPFFAYYEDVDLSFRAGLSGWRVVYEPTAVAYHKIGGTSSRMGSFTVTQTLQNLPLLFVRNVPMNWGVGLWLRFALAYSYIYILYFAAGRGLAATQGFARFLRMWPAAVRSRRNIRCSRPAQAVALSTLVTPGFPEYLKPTELAHSRRIARRRA